jgi:hypothetical protein
MPEEIARALARALALDPQIWSTPDRLRAVLMDLCPGRQAQRRVLVAAAEEGIVTSLSLLPAGTWLTPFPPQARMLSSRLQARTGIEPAFADWAVRQWSSALGLSSDLGLHEPEKAAAEPGRPVGAVASSLEATRARVSTAVARPPSPALPSLAGKPPSPPSRRSAMWKIAWLVVALVLPLLGGGLYLRTHSDVGPPVSPTPSAVATLIPAGWWTDPKNVRQLVTTFVGTLQQPGGDRAALFLQIRGIHIEQGRGIFEYTLNLQGVRHNNLGTLREGKLSVPDLGTAEVLYEQDHLLLRESSPSSQSTWELRATTPRGTT